MQDGVKFHKSYLAKMYNNHKNPSEISQRVRNKCIHLSKSSFSTDNNIAILDVYRLKNEEYV